MPMKMRLKLITYGLNLLITNIAESMNLKHSLVQLLILPAWLFQLEQSEVSQDV